jgi:hypothetical protein
MTSASTVPEPLRDALAERYAIEREIGAGGMAPSASPARSSFSHAFDIRSSFRSSTPVKRRARFTS